MHTIALTVLSILLIFSGCLEAIGTVTRTFFDRSRERALITTFWYPEPFAPGKLYPLILLSHNSGGCRTEMAWMAQFLAENGYIVAAVDHFGDTNYLQFSPEPSAVWERPKDLSYLAEVLTHDQQFGPRFKQDKVVVVGYSTGALAALWMAGAKANKHPKPQGRLLYRDFRVKAVIMLAPGYGSYFDHYGLEIVKIPVLVLAPQNDTVFPLWPNAMHFSKYIPNVKYFKIKGNASHDVFLCPGHSEKIKIQKSILEFLKTSI